MGIVVKHVTDPATGLAEYRRKVPSDLLPFIPGKEKLRWVYFKKALAARDAPDFGARLEAAKADYEAMVARARKMQAGAYDKLDSPTIAYLAEAFRVERLASSSKVTGPTA